MRPRAGSVIALVIAGGLLAGLALPALAIAPATTPTDFDTTGFEIHVYENGSARWTVEHTRILHNETEVQDFRAFMDSFAGSDSDLAVSFRERSRRMVASAEGALGRPMNATGFSTVTAIRELGQTRGVIELSFVWTNFARQSGNALVVGDVFAGGLYLLEDQRLVVTRAPGMVFQDVSPTPTSMAVPGNLSASSSLTWEGELRFADNRPYVQLVGAGGGGPASGGGLPWLPIVAGALVLVVLGLGAIFWSRRRDRSETTGSGAAPETPSVPPEELEADDERVLRLLEENGGRMKQVAIVDETDWSKSKVSMLLSDMEEEGQISKLRVGRENIVSLSGKEPDAAGSPFDEE